MLSGDGNMEAGNLFPPGVGTALAALAVKLLGKEYTNKKVAGLLFVASGVIFTVWLLSTLWHWRCIAGSILIVAWFSALVAIWRRRRPKVVWVDHGPPRRPARSELEKLLPKQRDHSPLNRLLGTEQIEAKRLVALEQGARDLLALDLSVRFTRAIANPIIWLEFNHPILESSEAKLFDEYGELVKNWRRHVRREEPCTLMLIVFEPEVPIRHEIRVTVFTRQGADDLQLVGRKVLECFGRKSKEIY